ncbi:MAG TPA: phospholipase A [Gammaproteobacteria bacterium]
MDKRVFRNRCARLVLCGTLPLLYSLPATADTNLDSCLLQALQQADNSATVGELRARCQARQDGLPAETDTLAPAAAGAGAAGAEPTGIEQRLALEKTLDDNPWVITPHKPNYLLPITYNSNVNTEPFAFIGEQDVLEDKEAKFQISFKFPLARNLFDSGTDAYFAYTNQSYWQVYTDGISAAFRETNHEPEVFFTKKNDWEFLGWKNSLLAAGFVHQSNGRSIPLSRSWNRIYASAMFERGNWALAIKPWYRIPEDEKTGPMDTEGDDNPDIYKYMGYGEIRLVYHNNGHVVTLMERNNLTSDSLGAVEVDYSFPLYGKMKGYVQYFYGYGESLIDYDARTNRIGVGVAISDWF